MDTESIQISFLTTGTKITNQTDKHLLKKLVDSAVKSKSKSSSVKNNFLSFSNRKVRDFLASNKKKQQQPNDIKVIDEKMNKLASSNSLKSKFKRKLFEKSSSSSTSSSSSSKNLDKKLILTANKKQLQHNIIEELSFSFSSSLLESQCSDENYNQNIVIGKTTQLEKEELGNVVANIYKLMDKSLGWLRSKSISKQRQQQKSLAKLDAVNTQFNSYFSDITQESQCTQSTTKTSELEANIYFKKSLLISAPSMSSSFNPSNPHTNKINQHNSSKSSSTHCHSTPRSLLNQVSPIFSPHQQRQSRHAMSKFNSSILETSVSASTTYSSPTSSSSLSVLSTASVSITSTSYRRRRLSFGVTSSPMSLSNSLFAVNSHSHSQSRILVDMNLNKNLNSTFFDTKRKLTKATSSGGSSTSSSDSDCPVENNNSDLDYFVDFKLLNRIDNFKRKNIKLNRMNNEKRISKRTLDDLTSNEDSAIECVGSRKVGVYESKKTKSSKRRKLQQMFQIKLKKQLNEIKKWQIGMRDGLDFEADEDYTNEIGTIQKRHMHSSRIIQYKQQHQRQPNNSNFNNCYTNIHRQQQQQQQQHSNNCCCYECFVAFRTGIMARSQQHMSSLFNQADIKNVNFNNYQQFMGICGARGNEGSHRSFYLNQQNNFHFNNGSVMPPHFRHYVPPRSQHPVCGCLYGNCNNYLFN